MKKLLVGLLVLSSLNAFSSEIKCESSIKGLFDSSHDQVATITTQSFSGEFTAIDLGTFGQSDVRATAYNSTVTISATKGVSDGGVVDDDKYLGFTSIGTGSTSMTLKVIPYAYLFKCSIEE